MEICYSNIVNYHDATLFYLQPVGLQFWIDSIPATFMISHLHFTSFYDDIHIMLCS